jgi:hypothetical protein
MPHIWKMFKSIMINAIEEDSGQSLLKRIFGLGANYGDAFLYIHFCKSNLFNTLSGVSLSLHMSSYN